MGRVILERFWSKVDKTPGHGPNGDCWVWIAAKVAGYGNMGFLVNGATQTFLAHRISYFIEYGKQPGEVLCHQCDNPACVRPDHLVSGTQQDNMDEREARGRGGQDKRRGQDNGRHTHPESTLKGEAWHDAHAASESKRLASRRRYLKEHPEAHRGANNPRSKLTEDDVRAIRAAYRAGGITMKALGQRYSVSKTVVQHIMKGKLWGHIQDVEPTLSNYQPF